MARQLPRPRGKQALLVLSTRRRTLHRSRSEPVHQRPHAPPVRGVARYVLVSSAREILGHRIPTSSTPGIPTVSRTPMGPTTAAGTRTPMQLRRRNYLIPHLPPYQPSAYHPGHLPPPEATHTRNQHLEPVSTSSVSSSCKPRLPKPLSIL